MASDNFVDYVKIHCTSGNGGAGSTHFRREKYITKGGPPIVQLGIQQAKEKLMRLVESNPELS